MKAFLNNYRGSARKFVKYLRAVQTKNAKFVVEQLRFMPGEYAEAVRKLISSAIANAANDSSVNVDNLIVKEATVGRGVFYKRVCFRGRGRTGRVTKPGANLRIILGNKEQENGK